ncbi:MAG: glycosyltransferase [Flavobacteriaceae bacterium]|nr:glycosyltransferase [Flavobacteriaceae bacterium]
MKANKTRILFVLPSLRSGGAERVMSFLAQNIDRSLFEPQLLITGSNKDQKYAVEGIPVTFLNKSRVQFAMPAMLAFLIRNRPHIAISAIGHLNMAMGLLGLIVPRVKFVARATTITGFNLGDEKRENQKSAKVYRLASKGIDRIICQSNDMKRSIESAVPESGSKITVINNPVTSKFNLKTRSFREDEQLKFITIGRLTERKGYIRVLEALAEFDQDFHYTIIGSGDFAPQLKAKVSSLELDAKVTFVDHTDQVERYLSSHDIYLQGSYVEGFPNALLESCATGTPSVVFDAPGGINEIIISGVNGFIAQNPQDFLEKLSTAANHPWSADKVRDSVFSRYSERKILEDYEQFFTMLTNQTES